MLLEVEDRARHVPPLGQATPRTAAVPAGRPSGVHCLPPLVVARMTPVDPLEEAVVSRPPVTQQDEVSIHEMAVTRSTYVGML